MPCRFRPYLFACIPYNAICITQYAWNYNAGIRMKKETRATRFADTVKVDKHKADQNHSVSVEVLIHQQGTINHEDVSMNFCKHFIFYIMKIKSKCRYTFCFKNRFYTFHRAKTIHYYIYYHIKHNL